MNKSWKRRIPSQEQRVKTLKSYGDTLDLNKSSYGIEKCLCLYIEFKELHDKLY